LIFTLLIGTFPLFGIIFYAIYAFYLIWAVIKVRGILIVPILLYCILICCLYCILGKFQTWTAFSLLAGIAFVDVSCYFSERFTQWNLEKHT
jgi:hypothetical protein